MQRSNQLAKSITFLLRHIKLFVYKTKVINQQDRKSETRNEFQPFSAIKFHYKHAIIF